MFHKNGYAFSETSKNLLTNGQKKDKINKLVYARAIIPGEAEYLKMQRCLSGLRSTTGNRVYVISVPRVQIPLSAPKKHLKKVLFLVFYGSMRNFSYSLLRNCVLACIHNHAPLSLSKSSTVFSVCKIFYSALRLTQVYSSVKIFFAYIFTHGHIINQEKL